MRKAKAALVGLILAEACAIAPANACWTNTDSVRPLERETYRIHTLFEQGKYDELDRLVKDPLDSMSDGQPRGGAVLNGLAPDDAACTRRTKSMEEARLKLLPAYRKRLEAWIARYPDSMLAKIALARVPYVEALMVRGNGPGSEVRPEAWEPFNKLISQAERELEALPAETKRDALWYLSMMEVALMARWPEPKYRALLEEATDRHPAYYGFYFKGLEYYGPQWGGSRDQVKQFIERYAAKAKPVSGDIAYARMQWSEESRDMFQSRQADWARMRAGFEQMIAKHPDNWNLNHFAKFACRAMDSRALASVMPRIQPPLIVVWKDPKYFEYCKELGNKVRAPATTIPQ